MSKHYEEQMGKLKQYQNIYKMNFLLYQNFMNTNTMSMY